MASLYRVGPAGVASPRFPVFTLPTATADARPDLELTVPITPYGVAAVDSPLWQIDGEVERRSPDGMLALVRPAEPARLTWLTRGLDTDGHVVRPVAVDVAGGHRVTVDAFAPAGDDQPAGVRIRLGGASEELRFGGGRPGEQRATFDLCDAAGPVAGAIEQVNSAHLGGDRFSAARIQRVRLQRC